MHKLFLYSLKMLLLVTNTERILKFQTIAYEFNDKRNYNQHKIIFNLYEQTSLPYRYVRQVIYKTIR